MDHPRSLSNRTPHQQVTPVSLTSPPALDRLRQLPSLSLSLASDYPTSQSISKTSSATYPPFLPSAGLTRRLLSSLQSTKVPHGCLTVWCVEGDNREDAYALTARVLDILELRKLFRLPTTLGLDVQLTPSDPSHIREPRSWKGLFGVKDGWSGGLGADSEIYG